MPLPIKAATPDWFSPDSEKSASTLALVLEGLVLSSFNHQLYPVASGAREVLYKALRAGAQPRFDTVMRVLRTLGVRLVAQPLLA